MPTACRRRAFELFAQAFAELAAAERETSTPTPAAEPEPAPCGLLAKGDLAKRLAVSVATVDRLTREGMPIAAHVGDARRFDLEACRAWLAARGKRPTKAPRREPVVDIDDVVSAAGLRVVEGGGR